MNKKRADYVYELVGKIATKQLKKDKSGNPFYKLIVNIENKTEVDIINVFPNLEKVWINLDNSKFHGKKYLFFCKNYMGNYSLLDWQELNQHG